MSAAGPTWADELGEGLAAEGAPETGRGTLGLLVLLLVLAAGALAARQLPAQLVEAERAAAETPQEQLRRKVQEALDAKAAGRYQEAWDKLRALHDADVHDPRVNLELAVLHEQIGNPDFASEYLALVEEAEPDLPRVGLLRARLELASARRLHKQASRVDVAPGRALELLAEARAALDLAAARTPEAATLDAPDPVRRELAEGLRRERQLLLLKEAKVLAEGTEGQRAKARARVGELLGAKDLDPDVRRQAVEVRDHLTVEPLVWRSGS